MEVTKERIEGGKQNVCEASVGTPSSGEQEHEHFRPGEQGRSTLFAGIVLLPLRCAALPVLKYVLPRNGYAVLR